MYSMQFTVCNSSSEFSSSGLVHVSRSPWVSHLPQPDSSRHSMFGSPRDVPTWLRHLCTCVWETKWVILWTLFFLSVQKIRMVFSCFVHYSCLLSPALSPCPSWDIYQPWFIRSTICLYFSGSSSLPSSLSLFFPYILSFCIFSPFTSFSFFFSLLRLPSCFQCPLPAVHPSSVLPTLCLPPLFDKNG